MFKGDRLSLRPCKFYIPFMFGNVGLLGRMDEAEWVRFKHQEKKKTAREHIIHVQHTKAQNAIGKGMLDTINRTLKYVICRYTIVKI